ncbi:MAG: ATPase P [Clostridia bacterium]|nr:ATPase P [Clostridia bacterium]
MVFIIALAVLTAGVLFFRIFREMTTGSSCCGTGEKIPKKIRVEDKDISHYSYRYRLHVEGMVCSACTVRVENMLNSLSGIWAKADLSVREVTVFSKEKRDRDFFVAALTSSTYTITDFEEEK